MKAHCKINSTYIVPKVSMKVISQNNVLLLLQTFSSQAKASTIKSCSYGHDILNKGEINWRHFLLALNLMYPSHKFWGWIGTQCS